MRINRFEKYFEMTIIGIVFYIGLVSLFYSWIDSAFNININVYVLTIIALIATLILVYLIDKFEFSEI